MKKNNPLNRIKELTSRIESDSKELNELLPLVQATEQRDELITIKQASILLGKSKTQTYELIAKKGFKITKAPISKVSRNQILSLLTPNT